MTESKPRVAVIGAGVAGLTTAKALREEGLRPVVFERSSHLGGVWRFEKSLPDGGGPAYESLCTNISRQAMGFSDYPMPESYPDFPTHREVLQYLEQYCRYFGLKPCLRLGHEVVSVRRRADRWELVVQSEDGPSETLVFEAVVVCSGRHQTVRWPELKGREGFHGRVLHSRDYTTPDPFVDRRVLVLGVGSSGVDLVEEIAPVARHTMLSTTRGAWLLPRTVDGRPSDHKITRLGNALPSWVRRRLLRYLIVREYRRQGVDPARSGLPQPPFDLERARITPGRDLARLLDEGKIEVVPGIQELHGDEVEFLDGHRRPVDWIVAATGYQMAVPFLREEVEREGRIPRLFEHVFPPCLPGLAFVGVPWVIGAYPPVLELQARWVARVVSGRCPLPTPEEMKDQLDRAVATARARRVAFERVQPVDYMDALARRIGCQPRWWRHPRLARQLLVGPLRPVHYRLDGPGRWEEAAAQISKCR